MVSKDTMNILGDKMHRNTTNFFFFFRQGFTGTPAAAGESENKSQVPLLTPKLG